MRPSLPGRLKNDFPRDDENTFLFDCRKQIEGPKCGTCGIVASLAVQQKIWLAACLCKAPL